MRAKWKIWLTPLTLCVAALLMVGVQAAGDADKAKAKAKAKAKTQTAVKAEAVAAKAGAANPLRWKFSKDAKRVYELAQTVTAKTNLPGAPAPKPIEVKGTFEMTGLDDGKAQLFVRAEKQGLPAPSAAPAPAATKPEPSSSCSCRRAAPAPVAKPVEPPVPSRSEGPRRMQALFTLHTDGTLDGTPATAGGQTELMTKLLLPLPGKLLQAGEAEEGAMALDAVGSRFPLIGTKKISYAELREVEGRPHALIKSEVILKGKGGDQPPAKDEHGHERPSKTMDGSMELKAESEGLFDIEGGFYRSVNARLWLQINTSRLEQGVKQDVTIEQTQESRLTLKAPAPAAP